MTLPFNLLLRDARWSLDLDQLTVARAVGVCVSSLCAWELGKNIPRRRNGNPIVRRLAQVLHLDADELVEAYDEARRNGSTLTPHPRNAQWVTAEDCVCSITGCDRSTRNDSGTGKGMCGMHHKRWKAHGDPLVTAVRGQNGTTKLVRVGETPTLRCSHCDKAAIARGFCATHWRRWRTHGDATVVHRGGPKPGTTRPNAPLLGSKVWSCGHARVCACEGSTGRCSVCRMVMTKGTYPRSYGEYVATTCRPCLAKRQRDRRIR